MQGKTNATTPVYAGIDVSKARLDIYLLPVNKYFFVTNDKTGHRKLKRELAKHNIACIAMEATGKLHRRVHRTLHEADLPVCAFNPSRSRHFASSIGQLAKTDKIDAKVLALFAQMHQLKSVRRPNPTHWKNSMNWCMPGTRPRLKGQPSAIGAGPAKRPSLRPS